MDEYIYYWKQQKVYCYRDELDEYREEYGSNYEAYMVDYFFNEIWEG